MSSGTTSRMEKGPQAQVTRKPSGPIGQMDMEKGPTGSGPTCRMEKGPTGTRHMEKGSSGDFYDELQASWMSNYRSHRYTSDGEGTMWRSMMKRHHYRSNIVHHRPVISSMTKPCSS